MVTSQSTTVWNDDLAPRRIWSAWYWRCMLVSGDTFFLLCSLSHAFFALTRLNTNIHCGWRAWILWMLVGLLSWIEGIRIVKPYAQRYTYCYRQGVIAIYCAIIMLACSGSILFLVFFCGDFTCYVQIVVPSVGVFGLLVSLWRLLYRFALTLFRFRPQVIVIGHSSMTDAVMHDICHLGRPAPMVLGYISRFIPSNLCVISWPYLGSRAVLRNLIQYRSLDMIVISEDGSLEAGIYQEIYRAMACGIDALALSDVYEYTLGQVSLVYEDSSHLHKLLWGKQKSLLYRSWRWILDLCFCVCGGCVFVALLPLIALLIYLDSPGPIFYWQERVGYRGSVFRLLKFRSMHMDSERDGAVWARQDDTRITRVGYVLRAVHLDELPQIFNILRGEMSLIGPRPERQMFVSQLEQFIPLFSHRLNVKPGLTGWAQVKMPYASTYQEAIIKLQHDLYYIKHRSFVLDVTILLKTLVEILWCSGR